MSKCYITDKECEFWEQEDEDDPGECLAVFIEQCPISDPEAKENE